VVRFGGIESLSRTDVPYWVALVLLVQLARPCQSDGVQRKHEDVGVEAIQRGGDVHQIAIPSQATMTNRPNFLEMARAWLVRAQGHARPENEKSLAVELERAWELGIANAIEALPRAEPHEWGDEGRPGNPHGAAGNEAVHAWERGFSIGIGEAETAIRKLTDKPTDPRGN
jgi:hypothetical protein